MGCCVPRAQHRAGLLNLLAHVGETGGICLRIMFLNARNKISRVTKESNFIEVQLSNYLRNTIVIL